MSLGFDWNNDGKEDLPDDMLTIYMMRDAMKRSGGSGGGCGTCLGAVLFFPMITIGLIVLVNSV